MTPQAFVDKWSGMALKERSASQSHFSDLCRLVGKPSPTDADKTGVWYTFERGADKSTGRSGWADVWKKGCFAWEYKGPKKDLRAAFDQPTVFAAYGWPDGLTYKEELERLLALNLERSQAGRMSRPGA